MAYYTLYVLIKNLGESHMVFPLFNETAMLKSYGHVQVIKNMCNIPQFSRIPLQGLQI